MGLLAQARELTVVAGRGRFTSLAAFGVYCVLSLLYFGRPVLGSPGRVIVGRHTDTNIGIWAFAWWPHALLRLDNPVITHAIWAPSGIDLAWTASSSGLAVVFSPVTLLVGPVASFDTAAILMPALAAWTGFLLCRYVSRAAWPSLVGGYVFGFSSYMLGHEAAGHTHMTVVFLVPLVALAILRYLDRALSRRGLALRLGILLAAQYWSSTELFATLTLALGVSVAIALWAFQEYRQQLRSLLGPIAAGYAIAVVLAGPLVYYTLTDFHSGPFLPAADYSADLVNLIIPTQTTAVGGSAASGISAHFPANEFEQGAYLGIPALLIVGFFLARRRADPVARFLALSLGVTVLAALGTALRVAGHRIVPLPWWIVAHLPALDKVFPVRLVLYATLLVAIAIALWGASTAAPTWLRITLPALAVLALVPNLQAGRWERKPDVPAFFAAGDYRRCLAPGENVLVIPYGYLGDALLWQARSDFRFRMPQGALGVFIPKEFAGTTVLRLLHDHPSHPEDVADIVAFARSKDADKILVYPGDPWPWAPTLARIGPPQKIGGMLLYQLKPGPATRAGCL